MDIHLKLSCKYRLDFAPHYVFTINHKLLVNLQSGKVIKQIMKGGSIGYVISGKFYSLTKLRENLEVIPKKEKKPF